MPIGSERFLVPRRIPFMRVAALFSLAVLFVPISCAQQFEVASVRPSNLSPQNQGKGTIRVDGAQVRGLSLSLKD